MLELFKKFIICDSGKGGVIIWIVLFVLSFYDLLFSFMNVKINICLKLLDRKLYQDFMVNIT
jgi:hypothetical protein